MKPILLLSDTEGVASQQIGQANFPFVTHPDKSPYVGKSLIVHDKAAFNLNHSILHASYV